MAMTIVESTSVETMAFNYVDFGVYVVVNNFWTLIAVATAAASFWRFKLAPVSENRHYTVHVSSTEISDESSPSISTREVNLNLVSPPLTVDYSDDREVTGKRVFTTRFYFDDVIDDENESVDDERLRLVAQIQHYQSKDKTVRFDVSERLRLQDLGVYGHLDMRVLDGNVVRLWDSCKARSSSSTEAILRRPIGPVDFFEGLHLCDEFRYLRVPIHQL